MPVFRIEILFANGEYFKEHHLNDEVDLDTYYRGVFRFAQGKGVPISSFDVVQVSEFSQTATRMRENNIVRLPHKVQKAQPGQQPKYRKRF